MFRKLTNRLASAANSVLGTTEDPNIQRLVSLGFTSSQATAALEATNGNVDQAAELLLAGGSSNNNNIQQQQQQAAEDEMLQRALQESLQQPKTTTTQHRTAAMSRAAQAAEKRAAAHKDLYTIKKKPTKPVPKKNSPPRPRVASAPPAATGLAVTHPDVKILPKMQDRGKEEQIVRCADRLKGYPQAVDTLLRALSSVQNDPNNAKFRTIDTSTAVFQRTLQNAPGALDLLQAMNYYTVREKLILDRSNVDPALLYLGVSALEQARTSPEYTAEKSKIVFGKEIAKIRLEGDSSEAESIQRASFMARFPTEPPEGRGALVQVEMADVTVMRRFDGDDTLSDILNWIAGHGTAIRDKIVSREWSLVDLNRYPSAPLDCSPRYQQHTLQYTGLFPSARLSISPSTPEWHVVGEEKASSSQVASSPRETTVVE